MRVMGFLLLVSFIKDFMSNNKSFITHGRLSQNSALEIIEQGGRGLFGSSVGKDKITLSTLVSRRV